MDSTIHDGRKPHEVNFGDLLWIPDQRELYLIFQSKSANPIGIMSLLTGKNPSTFCSMHDLFEWSDSRMGEFYSSKDWELHLARKPDGCPKCYGVIEERKEINPLDLFKQWDKDFQ